MTATSVVTNTLKVTGGSYTTTNAVLTTDGTGNAIWSSSGLYTLNGITAGSQTFSTTTTATSTAPSFTSSGTVHTLNIPLASEIETTPATAGTTAGLISKLEYNTLNNKQSALTAGQGISIYGGQSGAIGSGVYTVDIIATDADSEDKGIIKLAGDLTGSADLPTVNTVGGVSSSTITTISSSVLSATSNNTASTLVQRDGSGGFAAGAVTATSVVSSGNISSTSLTTGTLRVTGGTLAAGSVLTSDANGNATWGSNGLYTLNGQGATTHNFATSSTGNDFSISSNAASSTATHTFNLPDASISNRGVVTTGAQTFAGSKTFSGTTTVETLKVTSGAPTTAGFVLTASSTDGTASWQVASGGVTSVGAINTTSNAAGATVSGTTLNLAAADGTNGGVLTNGAQTIAGEKSFKAAVTNSEASPFTTRSINFSLSNLAYTSQSPGAFTLSGMKNGGTYTLAVQGTASGISSFTHPNFSIVSLGNYTTPGGKQTVYTFIVMGTTIYHSMVSEQ